MKTWAAILAGAALLVSLNGPAQARTRHYHHHRTMRHASASRLHVTRTAHSIRITGVSHAATPPPSDTSNVNTTDTGTVSVNDATRDNPRAADGGPTTAGSGTNNVPMTHRRRHSVTPPAAITNNGQSSAGTGAP